MIRLEVLWWLGWAWTGACAAVPLTLTSRLGLVPGLVAAGVIAPWTALLGLAVVHRLVPASPSGVYRSADAGTTRWAVKAWAPAIYLTLFQRLFFQSRAFGSLVLRAFGARLGRGVWVSSRTIVREPHRVAIGDRTIVGEFAHLACSLQPRPGALVIDRISIGRDALIGAYSVIGPGTSVGNDCVLGHAVILGPGAQVGDAVKIGAGCRIYGDVHIGAGTRIGKACTIFTGTRISPGTRLPDGSVVAGGRQREAQE